MKVIIFDFNRTLFNPEAEVLFPEVTGLLEECSASGYQLCLVAKGNGERERTIDELNLKKFFGRIIVHPEKTIDIFRFVQSEYEEGDVFFVVGDRVKKEIRFGNECGMKTIWLRKGKFAIETPETEEEKPDYIINRLSELPNIIF
jgi:FMN phosphatase YigB (HAD superfamily)